MLPVSAHDLFSNFVSFIYLQYIAMILPQVIGFTGGILLLTPRLSITGVEAML